MLGTRTSELPDCRPLLADPDDLTLVFQPIVDLAAATVAGYEALARFPGTAGPDVWFAAAAEAGVAAELEALAIHKALAAVPALPPDTFLTVNVSPHILGSAPVQAALATRPALHRVVIELTEHTPVHDLAALRRQTDELRARGAPIALDDAGSGYSGCSSSRSCGRRSSSWTGRWSATPTPTRCGSRWPRCSASSPAASTPGCSPRASRHRPSWPRSPSWASAAARLAARPAGTGFAPSRPRPPASSAPRSPAPGSPTPSQACPPRPPERPRRGRAGGAPGRAGGSAGRAGRLLLADPRTAEIYTAPVSLRVHPTTGISDTLQRASAPPAQRFDPVICTGPEGDVLGLLRIEDLASAARKVG